MSLNPGGSNNHSWHYSAKHEDRSLEITGTIVALQEVQAREYNYGSNQPGRPAFWPDGNPKMNIRVGLATPEGQLKSITFNKAGKKQISGEKPSLHMQLFNVSGGNMSNLMGKTVHVWTWDADPETGMQWGQGNPRKFGLELVPDAKYELAMPLPDEFKVPALYANDGASGGAPAPQQPQVQQANVMPMAGQFYAPPVTQQYQQPAYQPAPQYQQPAYQPTPQQFQQQMPAVQAMPPQSAPMPQGMDPAVAAAMQMAGATNVQPVASEQPPLSVYENDIPF